MSRKVAPEATVTLPIGVVHGTTLESGVHQYLGVPYAEPPIDTREAAFEAPKPLKMLLPEMEAGTREADAPLGITTPLVECAAAMCPCACGTCCCASCLWCCCKASASSEKTDGKGMGLDVLRMNVWTPPSAAKEGGLPVMVWIHGGGDSGSGRISDPNSRSGARLSKAQGVVVCVLDFRQGIFGVMDWGSDVPTNLELRDMVAALQFIQDHIGAFGGDKACVTIVGESIGGRRVTELMWCPAAKGLFHRAIATSPSLGEMANLSSAHLVYRRSLVNRYLGLPSDATPSKAELALTPRLKLVHAQAAAKGQGALLPATKLFGASAEAKKLFGAAAQVPTSQRSLASASLGFLGWRTVDGLRTGPFDASVFDGSYMPSLVGASPPAVEVPLLVLFTKDEFSALGMFGALSKVSSRAEALERLVHMLPMRGVLDEATKAELASDFLDTYASKVLPGRPLQEVYVAAMQDIWQYHPCISICTAHGGTLPGRAYLSTLTYDGKGGTKHGTDVSLFFGEMPGVPIHDKGKDFEGMTTILQEAYVAFARTGDPNTKAAPFAPFDAAAPKMTVLDSPLSGGGCKVVETMAAKDEAYRALVAAIRTTEK